MSDSRGTFTVRSLFFCTCVFVGISLIAVDSMVVRARRTAPPAFHLPVETVAEGWVRCPAPGGWVYRVGEAIVYMPDPIGDRAYRKLDADRVRILREQEAK